jgi:alpha-tubulin suppressor-like RCC1 family protein
MTTRSACPPFLPLARRAFSATRSWLPALVALSACGGSPQASSAGAGGSPGASVEPTGSVSLAILSVPAGVQCIQVTASGSTTVTQTFPVTPDAGTATALALGALPVGSVAITAQAYNVACASIGGQTPSWIADKQVITVHGGVILPLTLTFRPNNAVVAGANFVPNVSQIVMGFGVTAVVQSDGTVRGAGTVNFGGIVFGGTTFATLGAFNNVAQMALPNDSTAFGCVLLKNGTVQCWGDNSGGELGTGGAPASSSVPLAVSGISNVVQIAAGVENACALESNGSVWCWGLNPDGRVGNGTTGNVLSPVQVLTGATSIAAGQAHMCATTTNDNVSCWGLNNFGQLGVGNTTNQLTPIGTGLQAIVQVAAGAVHTCALRSDGAVFCWGANNEGQLGLGNTTNLSTPPATASITSALQVTATFQGTCARQSGGNVFCWGEDSNGEVGDGTGTFNPVTSPVFVQGLTPSGSIVGSNFDNCSIGMDQSVLCWGSNIEGQLGNGTTTLAPSPTPLGL